MPTTLQFLKLKSRNGRLLIQTLVKYRNCHPFCIRGLFYVHKSTSDTCVSNLYLFHTYKAISCYIFLIVFFKFSILTGFLPLGCIWGVYYFALHPTKQPKKRLVPSNAQHSGTLCFFSLYYKMVQIYQNVKYFDRN